MIIQDIEDVKMSLIKMKITEDKLLNELEKKNPLKMQNLHRHRQSYCQLPLKAQEFEKEYDDFKRETSMTLKERIERRKSEVHEKFKNQQILRDKRQSTATTATAEYKTEACTLSINIESDKHKNIELQH